jgi:hypothetical protein
MRSAVSHGRNADTATANHGSPNMKSELDDADWASFDIPLPDQLLAGRAQRLPGEGARALMSAVLEEAILCLSRRPPHVGRSRRPTGQLALQAERWVRSRDLRWPFSFENVCAALGLESGRMRTALLTVSRTSRDTQLRRSHRVQTFVPLAGGSGSRRTATARAGRKPLPRATAIATRTVGV